MATSTSDFKNGLSIYLDNQIFTIDEFQHVKPGKGGAFVRTRLKNAKTGSVLEKTFRAGEKVEQCYLEKVKMQYLYKQGGEVVLMNLESYEQINVSESVFGDAIKYLKEEMEVIANIADGAPIGYEVPNFVELQIIEADPGYKGDTVSGSSTKSAKLETGAIIQVPFHLKEGDIVKIDTRNGQYLERINKK